MITYTVICRYLNVLKKIVVNNQLPKKVFPFIWHFLREYKPTVRIYVGIAIISSFYGPFNNLLIKYITDSLLPTASIGYKSIFTPFVILLVANFIIFDNFTWRRITYIRAKYIPLIINQINRELMDCVLEKSDQFYQENLPSRILNNIVSVSNSIEDIISNMAPAAITSASWALTAIIVSYSVHPVFSCILFIWLILVVLSSIVMSRKLATRLDSQALAQSIVAEEMEDSLSHQSNVRMFSRKSFETSRMEKFFKKYQKAYTETHTYILIRYSVQGGLITIMMGCSCYFLLILYKRKLVTIGDFSLISGLSFDLGHMIWSSLTALDEFNRVASLCRQSLKALMLPLEIPDKPNAAVLKCTQGRISFDTVKFHYKDNKPLFENQSIDIQGGQKVGLVGYSGGGKSTFVHLILRLYDVTDGAILIDGQDISDVTQDSLRKNISMIPQDPSLFHRSLMENIRYGRIDASDEEVIEAAKKAHAHEFIEKLSQGYDSRVGEQGVILSEGQRQRIVIARAILKNAPILILDEATSQIDSVTESLIQESLLKLFDETVLHDPGGGATQRIQEAEKSRSSKTVLVIAHRLSTLLHMDRILVFDKGKIVEEGTHKELFAKAGLYKSLWDAQVGGFLGDNSSFARNKLR